MPLPLDTVGEQLAIFVGLELETRHRRRSPIITECDVHHERGVGVRGLSGDWIFRMYSDRSFDRRTAHVADARFAHQQSSDVYRFAEGHRVDGDGDARA